MILTISDFQDETAWERTVLPLAIPLTPLQSCGTNLDLRTKEITITLSDTLRHHQDELKNSLLPLLFGAAWKILDLTVELALATGGAGPRSNWTIKDKTIEIGKCAALPGFSASSDLWRAVIELYRSTQETRHALEHRRVTVDPQSQDLIGFDRQGQALTPLTTDEQMAFCRVAQQLAEAVDSGVLRGRVESDLLGQLAILKRHHNISIAGSVQASGPVRLIDDFPANGRIDVPNILMQASSTFPAAHYIDLELELPDTRRLIVELEQAPPKVAIVNLAALPTWIRFI